jgi:hypothetical protein
LNSPPSITLIYDETHSYNSFNRSHFFHLYTCIHNISTIFTCLHPFLISPPLPLVPTQTGPILPS